MCAFVVVALVPWPVQPSTRELLRLPSSSLLLPSVNHCEWCESVEVAQLPSSNRPGVVPGYSNDFHAVWWRSLMPFGFLRRDIHSRVIQSDSDVALVGWLIRQTRSCLKDSVYWSGSSKRWSRLVLVRVKTSSTFVPCWVVTHSIASADHSSSLSSTWFLWKLISFSPQCQVRFGGRTELATDSDSRYVRNSDILYFVQKDHLWYACTL